ncbi:MAG: hypothetical protein GXP46_06260 [Deferribacteres bacterium]|nr:hypothetical protein [Deferribacteres bacterium]
MLLLCLAVATLTLPDPATAVELSGWMQVEGRYFFQGPLYQEQDKNSLSFAVRPDIYREWAGGSSFTFIPFYRYDSADSQRTHFDIREAMFLWPREGYELRAGIGKVFWGVTEGRHLVDIINQTDLVESINEEEKLGQPMTDLTLLTGYGTLDFFVLPYFRKRTFPGRKGRLRFDPFIDTGRGAVYESTRKEHHIDYALRYSNTIGNWDIGFSHFYGTSREPAYLVQADSNENLIITPYYEIINQTGLDLQYVNNAWLWKLEAIYRSGLSDGDFYAVDAGFEYTFSGLDLGSMDIGLIMEYLYDSRDSDMDLNAVVAGSYISSRFNTFLDNDYLVGLRLAFNDAASSEVLTIFTQDLNNHSTVFQIEASRRIGDRLKVELNTYLFVDAGKDPVMGFLRNDSFMQIALMYYF